MLARFSRLFRCDVHENTPFGKSRHILVMVPLVWVLYCVLISVVIACATFVFFRRKALNDDSTPVEERLRFLKKSILPGRATGWRIWSIDNGVRIWERSSTSTVPSWITGPVYSCFGKVSSSVKEVFEVLKDEQEMLEWYPGVKEVSKVKIAGNSDVVSVLPRDTGTIKSFMHSARELCGLDNNMVYARHWGSETDAWLFFSALQGPTEGPLWTCLILTPVQSGPDEQEECLLTILVSPASSSSSCIQNLTSCSLAGLQNYFCLAHLKSAVNSQQKNAGGDPAKVPATQHSAQPVTIEGHGAGESGYIVVENTPNDDASRPKPKHRYQAEESRAVENLLRAYNAQEGTDGWVMVGNMKGVEIHKRSAQPGERPWDCLKGATTIAAPIHYILAYVFSLDYRGEWDDLYRKGDVVEEADPLTKVSRMEYKPVWPASGRDFCNLAMLRELLPNVYGLAVGAMEHPNCPPTRDPVRAEIVVGGFVVKELCSDPPSCDVTYVTRVDLKGNLPVRLVNRVASSQPQALAVLRDKLEARYREDEKNVDSENMSDLQKQAIDYWMELMRRKEARAGAVASSVPDGQESQPEGDGDGEERSIVGSVDSETFMEAANIRNRLAAAEASMSCEPDQATEEIARPPIVGRHQIDLKTLGNQTAATLLGELALASKMELSGADDYSTEMKKGDWNFLSVEKNVVISRKISPGEKIHSFLGKGLIKLSPPIVWNAIKNYMTRYVYDRMLKKTTVVKTIDEQTKILYLHHETTQCFVKQSRDFVLLSAERTERERYVLAATSVDVPDCPPNSDIIRGTVFSSGWVLEPVLQNGRLYTMVSYLSQVDLGGVVPIRLLNLIARRQPLCIAYLREYLETSEKKAASKA